MGGLGAVTAAGAAVARHTSKGIPMTPPPSDLVARARRALIECLRDCGMTAVDAVAAADDAAGSSPPPHGPAAGGRPAARSGHRGPSPDGFVLVYSMVAMVGLLALGSLAVDYGHVQLAKVQVQRAADAAARAGAVQLGQGGDPALAAAAAVAAATATAAANPSDDHPLVLAPADVLVGNWDPSQTPAFAPARLPLNACRVALARDGVANPAVPLTLAAVVGANACDVHASATAHVDPPPSPYGLVGIDRVSFGSLGVLATVTGDLASNGPVRVGTPLGVGVTVSGNVRSYNSAVTRGSATHVGGVTTPLSDALTYPDVQLPRHNDNARVAAYLNGTDDFTAVAGATVPAGTYVVHDLNLLGGVAVNVAGPVVFYVTGQLNLAAGVNLLGSPNTDPLAFVVNVVRGGAVRFLANLVTPIAMVIYAPQSDIVIAVGVNRFTGTLVGKTLDVTLPVLGTFVEVKPAARPPAVTTDV